MIFSFRHKRWIKRKTFYVSVRNRTLRWMNIYGYLWKNLSISTKCEICTSLKILAIFFINKKFSTFFCFFAFLEYHGTLRISLFSKLSAWENILTVIVRYPKLPNHSTMHTCVLSPSIFSVILITNDYIQVDMGALHTVCAIATQGKKNGPCVKSYKLSFSIDESSWSVYQEQNIGKVWNNSTLIFFSMFYLFVFLK